MRTIQYHLLSFLIAFLLPATTQAQEMKVRSMVFTPMDQTANLIENMYSDDYGNYGGLVKVMLAVQDAEFEGKILEQRLHGPGEYWVFMEVGSDELTVRIPDCPPLKVNFRNYEDCVIKSKQTCVLTILAPKKSKGSADDDMCYLVIKVEPENSVVTVDGTKMQVENGEMVGRLSMGKHKYLVTAPGYASQEGTVDLEEKDKSLSITLVSVMATLHVECPTSGAGVFINGQQRGVVPWSGQLPAGRYQVEARKDGYRIQSQGVSLKENEDRKLEFFGLDMLTGALDISVAPDNADVYIDERKMGATPIVLKNIMVGNHTVDIRKAGLMPLKKTVTVKENEKTFLTGKLSGPPEETFTVNGVSFAMISVNGGIFTMGATSEQGTEIDLNASRNRYAILARSRSESGLDFESEKPIHQVTLSDFSIGETEVTQALWQAVMGRNPSQLKGDNLPVGNVSWNDCQEFISKLNQLTGRTFSLPTEAQWEYAARGGLSNGKKFSGSNDIGTVAWYRENSEGKMHPVKTKAPNELGLYDMSGNVKEWCKDCYGFYSHEAQTNPRGPEVGLGYVYRGGSYDSNDRKCRVPARDYYRPQEKDETCGFRLAMNEAKENTIEVQ